MSRIRCRAAGRTRRGGGGHVDRSAATRWRLDGSAAFGDRFTRAGSAGSVGSPHPQPHAHTPTHIRWLAHAHTKHKTERCRSTTAPPSPRGVWRGASRSYTPVAHRRPRSLLSVAPVAARRHVLLLLRVCPPLSRALPSPRAAARRRRLQVYRTRFDEAAERDVAFYFDAKRFPRGPHGAGGLKACEWSLLSEARCRRRRRRGSPSTRPSWRGRRRRRRRVWVAVARRTRVCVGAAAARVGAARRERSGRGRGV